jgi:hypothetical protein
MLNDVVPDVTLMVWDAAPTSPERAASTSKPALLLVIVTLSDPLAGDRVTVTNDCRPFPIAVGPDKDKVFTLGSTIVNVSDTVADWNGVLESITLNVSGVAPDTTGIPLMVPVLLSKLSPVGSVPDKIDQLYGMIPPLAERLAT